MEMTTCHVCHGEGYVGCANWNNPREFEQCDACCGGGKLWLVKCPFCGEEFGMESGQFDTCLECGADGFWEDMILAEVLSWMLSWAGFRCPDALNRTKEENHERKSNQLRAWAGGKTLPFVSRLERKRGALAKGSKALMRPGLYSKKDTEPRIAMPHLRRVQEYTRRDRRRREGGVMDDEYYIKCPECGELIAIDNDLSKVTQCRKCGWDEYDDICDECQAPSDECTCLDGPK
jgi:hypothetical protein